MIFNITITGIDQLKDKLGILDESLLVWPEEMIETGSLLISYLSQQVYVSRGSVFGESWADLNPGYAKSKVKKYPGKGILVASGAMQSGYYSIPADTSVTVLNHQEYAEYHQTGTRKMPQRILFAINDQMAQAVGEVFRLGVIKRIETI